MFTDNDTRMKILSLWDGQQFIEDTEYELQPTPCVKVIKGNVYYCTQSIQNRFPKDPRLKKLAAESFRGVPLVGPNGNHFGHLAIVDTKPMKDEPGLVNIMQIFAMRAAAELARIEAEERVLVSEKRLDAILNDAMDAIININNEGIITLFNKAAERIFKCGASKQINRFIAPLLSKSFNARIQKFIKSGLAGKGKVEHNMRIPENVAAIRDDGIEFPIEGTISRTIIENKNYYTLIFQDITERVATRKQIRRLKDQREHLSEEIKSRHNFQEIVGESKAIQDILDKVKLVSKSEATVLILGETGTGKELIARAVHFNSDRSNHPLIKVNCAALPENLIESELFGHEKGSFTGATANRIGRFELADNGTIFLDEIGELPLPAQAKLLRVLQEQELERVGGTKTIKVNTRVIAATNRNLEILISDGKFRDDLFYRLCVFPIHLTPLRERREDIAVMANFFVNRYARKIGRTIKSIPHSAIDRLTEYHWPGNIRELENVIERAMILTQGTDLQIENAFITSLATPGARLENQATTPGLVSLEDAERDHIEKMIAHTSGVIGGPKGAAELLKIHPSTLRSRMKKLGISASAE